MSQIGKRVRDAVRSVLSDATNGFNANLAAIAATYGVTAFTVNWTATSLNFFQSNIDPNSLDEANVVEHQPTVLLYTVAGSSLTRTKPAQFSGDVTVNVDFWIGYSKGSLPHDTESMADAIEDAIVTALQHPSAAWPEVVCQTGNFRADRAPVFMAGEHWRQLIRVPVILTLDTE